MTAFKALFSLEKLSGLVTWAVVTGMSLLVMVNNDLSALQIAFASVLYLSYIVLWFCLIRETEYARDTRSRMAILVILFGIVVTIYFVVPLSFNSILMGIITGALPYFFSVKRSLIISSLMSLPLFFVFTYHWEHTFVFLTASLFWTFNIFAVIMVNSTVNEKLARQQAEDANRQLLSAQALLKEASKQSERVRIARNIHDLLGHHLTALTINLQVASLKTNGEVKQSIDQCHQLAKLLLSDVREAVSDIRDKSQVDLKAAIQSMSDQVSGLNIDLDLADNLKIDDLQIADTLMKCIQESVTNTIKHGRGKHVSIALSQDANNVKLRIQSDGKMPATLIPGNGLKGMKERIALVSGSIEFMLSKQSLITDVMIPLNTEQLA
ncbi:sensor histidine kinase [Glaciecola sp. SC05]|uniref:sensor histidine kinase n=1 Tax=Glaciecola sp. SC05 TaxID=1987355 RepID=UPI0035294A92